MNYGKNLKKLIGISLAIALTVGVLTACGQQAKTNEPTSNHSESSDENSTESTFSPKGADQKPSAAPTQSPQTAEEAANDISAITAEIASLDELISEELYDDALMQIRALLTKNLSDSDKEKVLDYQKLVEEKLGM